MKKSILFLWALCAVMFISCSKDSDDGGGDTNVVSSSDAIDLGLSVKWAACNIGASAPEGKGGYYAWGEIKTKSDYSESTYSYKADGGYTDIGSIICGTQYDVAHVTLGGKWRMPTLADLEELREKCTWVWTTLNDVKGMKIIGPNGKSIFLPAEGCREGDNVYKEGSNGYYWLGFLDEESQGGALSLNFYDNGDIDYGNDRCCYGIQVRPVYDDNNNYNFGGNGEKHTVDLGLSVKWASCNVGASSPEGTGGYYAWGETEVKSNYKDSTYKYYVDFNYTDLGYDICGSEYDVARVKWGGKWRMPTLDEQNELKEKCTWTGTIVNGVSGMKVTGPNGNSIFLPAAGYRDGTGAYHAGHIGYYWSGMLYESDESHAWGIDFNNTECDNSYYYYRYYGCQVRPVEDNKEYNDSTRPVALTGDTVEVTYCSAKITCSFKNIPANAQYGIIVTSSNGTSSFQPSSNYGDSYTFYLEDLQPQITYTYQAYILYHGIYYYGDKKNFTTLKSVVKGSYTGSIYIGTSTTPKSITAKVDDSNITLNSFPVSDLISQYMGDAAASIIASLSPINYAIPYTATATSTGYALTLKPDTLPIIIPTGLTTSMTVKVVFAGQSATYTESTKNLAFNITATQVIVAGVAMPTFSPTAFKISLTK